MKTNQSAFCILVITFIIQFIGCSNIYEPEDSYLYEDRTPAWSPDGNWIAYYHFNEPEIKGYPTGLYIIDIKGKNRQLIKEGNLYGPDWSPDGEKIAFSDSQGIYIINKDGTNLTRLTEGHSPKSPSWSPDGNRIAYATWDRSFAVLCLMNLNTKEEKYIATRAFFCDPDWSPDGTKIIYATGDIFISDTTGNNVKMVYKLPYELLGNNAPITDPNFSLDGQWITFSLHHYPLRSTYKNIKILFM